MIFMEALEKFGLGESTSLLEKFAISQWGTVIHLRCLYDPYLKSPYNITLNNSTKVELLIHSQENVSEDLLSITDIQIKSGGDNQQEFIMYTEVFELIVICGNINVSKSTE
jgi:hypothetical protein